VTTVLQTKCPVGVPQYSPWPLQPHPSSFTPLCTIAGKLAALAFAPDGTAIVCDRNAPPKPTTRVDGALWHHCRFCEHAAKNKSNIKMHEASHLGDKGFECQYCDGTFTRKELLVKHERTHTGERPFECQYCDKTFTQKINLVNHERAHTGERPHGCGECGARFALSGHLVSHQRTHTGIKPYLCSVCDYAAAQSSQVTRHIKRRHPGSGAVYINATRVLEGPAPADESAPPAHSSDPSLTTERERVVVPGAHAAASEATSGPATTAPEAPEAPLPCPDMDVMDPGLFVRGSLLRLLHATPEQQAALLATEEYLHLREGRASTT
jgi:hypothetical protein